MAYGDGAYGDGAYGVEDSVSGWLSAIPEPEHRPPRVRLELDTGSDDVTIRELSVTRDGEPVRVYFSVGGRRLVAYDHEPPYGRPVQYEATGVSAGIDGEGLEWAESWADGSAWTVQGPWTFSGEAARLSYQQTGKLSRALPAHATRITLAGTCSVNVSLLAPSGAVLAQIALSEELPGIFERVFLARLLDGDGAVAGRVIQYGPDTDAHLVTISDDVLSLQVAGEVRSVGLTSAPATLVIEDGSYRFRYPEVGPIEVYAGESVDSDFTATALTQLDSACAWLVHQVPSLSVCIDARRWRDDALNLQGTAAKTLTRPVRSTRYDPPGRSRAVFFRHGQRQLAEWELALMATTVESLAELEAMVTDQSPVLLRVPPDWDLDLRDDWYQLGDFTAERVTDTLSHHYRRVTLPMTPTEPPPLLGVPPWSWADVEAAFESWADVEAAFESWAELEVGGW